MVPLIGPLPLSRRIAAQGCPATASRARNLGQCGGPETAGTLYAPNWSQEPGGLDGVFKPREVRPRLLGYIITFPVVGIWHEAESLIQFLTI